MRTRLPDALADRPLRGSWRILLSLVRLSAARLVGRRWAEHALQPTVPYYEGRIVADLRTPTGRSLYRYGPRDRDLDVARRFAREGGVLLDCGANIGLFTVAMALACGERGTVYAFEPVAAARRALLRNLAASGCTNVVVFPFAVGEGRQERELVVMPEGGFSSFRPDRPERGTSTTVVVDALDTLVPSADRGRVRFVKVDVEGAEMGVLRGARRILAASRPPLLLEVEDAHLRRQGSSAAELRRTVLEHGYRHAEGPGRPNELFVPDGPAAAPVNGARTETVPSAIVRAVP